MVVAAGLLLLFYVMVLAICCWGMVRLQKTQLDLQAPKTLFSVVIPFRNEADALPALLVSLQKLHYPNEAFEIIFVDDASTDASEAIIHKMLHESSLLYTILKNQRHSASPKKDAIQTAIQKAAYPWIITTDADCRLPPNWLHAFTTAISQQDPVMLCGPVVYSTNDTFLQHFQHLDALSLQAVTMGSFYFKKPLLCNGANLAYTKEAFYAVKGFTENDHIGSGDDVFLLQKMELAFPGRVQYVKCEAAIVTTTPVPSWQELFQQRIRWASKTTAVKNGYTTTLGILVFLTQLFLLLGWIYCFFEPRFILIFAAFFSIKLLADYVTLRISRRFFRKNSSFKAFIGSFLLHPLLVCLVVVGSLKGKYQWKGRHFKR